MEDKTPLYMLAIVGVVAIVAVIVMVGNGVSFADDTGITANAVYDMPRSNVSDFSLNIFGKVFFTLFLVGIAAYMYFRKD